MYEKVPVCLFVNVCMWLFIYVHDVSGGEKLFAYLSIIVSHQVVPWGLLGSGTSSNKPQIAFNWEVLYGKCLWYSCLLLLFSHFWMWRPFVSVLLKDPWSSFSYSLLYWWRVFHRDAFLYSIITCACISPSSHPHTSYSHPTATSILAFVYSANFPLWKTQKSSHQQHTALSSRSCCLGVGAGRERSE